MARRGIPVLRRRTKERMLVQSQGFYCEEDDVQQHEMKMEMPKFYGSLEQGELMKWIKDMQ